MRELLVTISKRIYKCIPSQSIKDAIYNAFAFFVRDTTKIVNINGINYQLDLGERIDLNIYLQSYEKDMCQAIDKLCDKDWYVADIGANIGAHTLRLAEKVGNFGKVFAFEPTNYAYHKLRKNISLNMFNNIQAYQVALSDCNLANKEITYKSSWRTYGKPITESSIVDFVKFDDWYLENKINRLDFIKIDVDGNEYSVLAGARRVLSEQHPIILIEIGPYHFLDKTTNPLLLLDKLDYKFWNIHTLSQYKHIDELQEIFNANKKIDSINIIAATNVNTIN